jgi:hypothetical protein
MSRRTRSARLALIASVIGSRLSAAGLLAPALAFGPSARCVHYFAPGSWSAAQLQAVASAAGVKGALVDTACGVVCWA